MEKESTQKLIMVCFYVLFLVPKFFEWGTTKPPLLTALLVLLTVSSLALTVILKYGGSSLAFVGAVGWCVFVSIPLGIITAGMVADFYGTDSLINQIKPGAGVNSFGQLNDYAKHMWDSYISFVFPPVAARVSFVLAEMVDFCTNKVQSRQE
jgi:hypothetical protein